MYSLNVQTNIIRIIMKMLIPKNVICKFNCKSKYQLFLRYLCDPEYCLYICTVIILR